MKLTRAASYALQAVVYIATKKREKEEPVASHKLARDCGIPSRFLLKVLKPLVQKKVLQSIKGPKGGYSLARPANEITMLDVLQAADNEEICGSVPPNKKPNHADPHLLNRLEQICDQTAEQVKKHLSKVRISELVSKD